MAVETEILVERSARPFDGMKISWGGVFGGVLAGIGALMLLSSLGLAIGISATDPVDPNGQALGIGAAVWTGLTLLISLFLAGWASTRLSMLWERTTAMFEGVLVWVLSLVLILYLTASGIGLVANGAFNLIGSSAQTAVTDPARAGAEVRQNMSNLAAQARQNLSTTAAQAKPEATKTAWITFGALVLSLLTAVIGAMVGRREPQSQLKR